MVWAPETNDLTVYVKRKLRRCYVRPASLCIPMEEQWGGLTQMEFLRGLTCLHVRWNLDAVWDVYDV